MAAGAGAGGLPETQPHIAGGGRIATHRTLDTSPGRPLRPPASSRTGCSASCMRALQTACHEGRACSVSAPRRRAATSGVFNELASAHSNTHAASRRNTILTLAPGAACWGVRALLVDGHIAKPLSVGRTTFGRARSRSSSVHVDSPLAGLAVAPAASSASCSASCSSTVAAAWPRMLAMGPVIDQLRVMEAVASSLGLTPQGWVRLV